MTQLGHFTIWEWKRQEVGEQTRTHIEKGFADLAGIALRYLGEHLAVERRVNVPCQAVHTHNRSVGAFTGHHYNPAAFRVTNAVASMIVNVINEMSMKLKLPHQYH